MAELIMKFEINIIPATDGKEMLLVLLFTKDDEEYLKGSEEGIYNCGFALEYESRKNLIKAIETSVNACLNAFNKDMKQALDNIIYKSEPKLKDFQQFIHKEMSNEFQDLIKEIK